MAPSGIGQSLLYPPKNFSARPSIDSEEPKMTRYDLMVIGSGPAGYVSAIRAAQLGAHVAVAEEEDIGGTCLNRGCIPTKTLAATADLLHASRNAARMGLKGSLELDFPAVAKRRDLVVTRLRKGIEARLAGLGIDVLRGEASIPARGSVCVGGETFEAANILVATGSRPAFPGPLRVEGALSSTEVLAWRELPRSLVIIGGGVVGCEFASILRIFGVEVTVLEMMDDILPGIDSDIRQVLRNSLSRLGVKILTGRAAASASVSPDLARVVLDDGSSVEGAALLVAAGRIPRLDVGGLAECGVEFDRKGIRVDSRMKTSVDGIYAAGDVTGLWQLAHAGSAQGLAAVEGIFAPDRARPAPDPDTIPSCVFTTPEIASVGPGEEEWIRRGVPIEVRRARYVANGRAVGLGETEGMIKLIASAGDGRLLGVQMVGRDASSLVGEALVAVNCGLSASRLGEMIHPHPTLTEIFMEAGDDFGPGAVHG